MKTAFFSHWRGGLLTLAAMIAMSGALRAQTLEPQFSVASDWGSGFTADVNLLNQTGAVAQNWVLTITFSGQISDIWNGVILSHTGNVYLVGPASWNAQIPAAGTVDVGFQGSPGSPAITTSVTYETGASGGGSSSGGASSGSGSTGGSSGGTSGGGGTVTGGTTGVAGSLTLATYDTATAQANQVDAPLGVTTLFSFAQPPANVAALSVMTNNESVVKPSITADGKLSVQGLATGRAGLKIVNSVTGEIRYLGVRVLTASGAEPGMPSYLGIGSVGQDTDTDLAFFRAYANDGTNKRLDYRYIYLTGGPENVDGGWRTWTVPDGFRVTSYVRESERMGMIPIFVYYNLNGTGDGYFTDSANAGNATFMLGYFQDLLVALQLAQEESGGDLVGFVVEPDFLGYFAQSDTRSPDQIPAMTEEAYAAGALTQGVDPNFPDTLHGLVQAINYIIHKHMPTAFFGWEYSLWASPPGGWTTPIPGTGLMHLTDTLGVPAGRTAIYNEAAAIAKFYEDCGVLTNGASFVSMDKYGLDAGYEGKANTPAQSTWFWNAVQWTNYLVFANALHTNSGLPVVLWQLPVGHINQSLMADPYAPGQLFPLLANTFQNYEDSAPTYFFGDAFSTTVPARLAFFGATDGGVSNVTVSGNTTTWGRGLALAKQAGVKIALFGAGVGDSTQGTGTPPTDNYWWISKVQSYYSNPVLLEGPDDGVPIGGSGGGTSGGNTSGGTSGSGGNSTSGGNTTGGGNTTSGGNSTSGGNTTGGGNTTSGGNSTSGGNTTSGGGNTTGGGSSGGNTTATTSVQVTFADTDDWGSGFTGYMTIKNTGTAAITSWKLTFDSKFSIGTYWNAVLVSSAGKHYVMTNESWNGGIAPGASVQVGFNGAPGKPAAPTNVVVQVNGGTVNVAAAVKSSVVTAAVKTTTTKASTAAVKTAAKKAG